MMYFELLGLIQAARIDKKSFLFMIRRKTETRPTLIPSSRQASDQDFPSSQPYHE